MILRCDCVNTSADAVYGRGLRPHTTLNPAKMEAFPRYCCVFCSYVRTDIVGRRTGAKGERGGDTLTDISTGRVNSDVRVPTKALAFWRPTAGKHHSHRQPKRGIRARVGRGGRCTGATTKGC